VLKKKPGLSGSNANLLGQTVKSAGGWGQEPRKISGGGRSGYDRTLKYFKKNTVNEKTLGLKRAGT
jgi:hypothetical protein